MAGGAAGQRPRPPPIVAPEGDPALPERGGSTRGGGLVAVGAVVAVLAPLAGFLGGSMAGSTDSADDLDPLFAWLFGGLVIGGAGAVLAVLAGMRWMRRNRGRL